AARRELREETGYTGESFVEIACHYANPANQTNLVRSYLALDVLETDLPSLDPNEEIEVVKHDLLPFLRRFWDRDIPLQGTHASAIHTAAHLLMTGQAPSPPPFRDALISEFFRS
ncbi:NUDIX hydrolase, partial [Singulisphaera rosea]